MRTITLISTSSSIKQLEFGFNANELSSFKLQAWITRVGKRAVDTLQQLSLGFVSFMGGNIYLHNDDTAGAERCTLFGEHKDMKVGFVINEQASVTKILESIGIHTDDDNWEVESLTIEPSESYPDGMYSIIPKNKFVKRDNILYADFMRNMKTSGSTISYIEAITGEELRGRTAYVILKNTSTERVQLYEIDVTLTKSR